MRRVPVGLAAVVVAVALAPASSAQAGEGRHSFEPSQKELAKMTKFAAGSPARARRGRYPRDPQQPGAERTWLAGDFEHDEFYLKDFTLRALGRRIEVWVASDENAVAHGIDFPAGDCRNGTDATRVTDEQIARLVREFDDTIYPRLTATFFKPAPRGGQNATLTDFFPEIPRDGYAGDPRRIVVLVDNIRDADFYGGKGGTLGFVHPRFRELFDRQVLTLDSASWAQLLGSRPRPAQMPQGCEAEQPVPHYVEFTLAHEFGHVMHLDEGRLDERWLDEGLADWGAYTLDYVSAASTEPLTGNNHVQCFLGSLESCRGGPENSLTVFPEGPDVCQCTDYGAAFTFLHTAEMAGGKRLMRELGRDPREGLESLRGLLAEESVPRSDRQLVQDWSTTVALDAVLDDGARLRGGSERRFQAPRLHAQANLDSPRSHQRPGVTANGADFVRLREASGAPLDAASIDSIRFDGNPILPPIPVRWTVDDGALHVASGSNADEAIVREVSVDAADPTLAFRTRHEIEEGWDFGFVQVSTDGGRTFASLPATTTTSEHDPGAIPAITAQLPGFTGDSDGWVDQRVDLSAYAGQNVLLSFRSVTDPFLELAGWWIDDVAVSGSAISDGTTLDGWRSLEQVQPPRAGGMTVRLVGYSDDRRRAFMYDLPLDADLDGTLSGDALRAAAGGDIETVAAIVSHYEPNEEETRAAHYALTVDGALQAGG